MSLFDKNRAHVEADSDGDEHADAGEASNWHVADRDESRWPRPASVLLGWCGFSRLNGIVGGHVAASLADIGARQVTCQRVGCISPSLPREPAIGPGAPGYNLNRKSPLNTEALPLLVAHVPPSAWVRCGHCRASADGSDEERYRKGGPPG